MIKCCIFDLDGTLLNTISTISYYVNKTFAAEGIEAITEEECKSFVGDGPQKLIERALASKKRCKCGGVSRILENYKKNYASDNLYLTAPYDGIKDMLIKLSEKKIVCAVLSNKQEEATVPIVEAFFGELIKLTRGARDGVPLKPSPDAVFEIIRELGFSPSETAYIGDTGVDMKTGKAFSAKKTIGVTWGFRDSRELLENGADVIVDNAEELLSEVLA